MNNIYCFRVSSENIFLSRRSLLTLASIYILNTLYTHHVYCLVVTTYRVLMLPIFCSLWYLRKCFITNFRNCLLKSFCIFASFWKQDLKKLLFSAICFNDRCLLIIYRNRVATLFNVDSQMFKPFCLNLTNTSKILWNVIQTCVLKNLPKVIIKKKESLMFSSMT